MQIEQTAFSSHPYQIISEDEKKEQRYKKKMMLENGKFVLERWARWTIDETSGYSSTCVLFEVLATGMFPDGSFKSRPPIKEYMHPDVGQAIKAFNRMKDTGAAYEAYIVQLISLQQKKKLSVRQITQMFKDPLHIQNIYRNGFEIFSREVY